MSLPTSPRVSVILPTHNRPTLLREALDSLCVQTFTDWEAIIIDDASTPAVTLDRDDARVRIIRHEIAQGGAAAKNTGIQNARGEILAFLDDDDCYEPRYLERALDVLDHHPALDVVFMGVTWFGSNGAWGQRNYDEAMRKFQVTAGGHTSGMLTVFNDAVIAALLKSVPMALQRPVVRSSALAAIGNYRPDCLLWDCDWAIAAALNARTGLLAEGLYRQRADGQGYSSKRDRTVEQLESNVEIKDRLWQQSHAGRHPDYRDAFRRSAADGWFDLAWHYYQQGNRSPALHALTQSARRQLRLDQLKLLVRLMLPPRSSSSKT
jgi:glycosyltransferase involved in cell wall biosynthesis